MHIMGQDPRNYNKMIRREYISPNVDVIEIDWQIVLMGGSEVPNNTGQEGKGDGEEDDRPPFMGGNKSRVFQNDHISDNTFKNSPF